MFVLLVLLVSTLLVEGHRNRESRRERGRPRQSGGNEYTWRRDLGNGNTVQENATVPRPNEILLKSQDNALAALGYAKASVLYYFTAETPKISISLTDRNRKSPCFIADSPLSYEDVISALASRNGSVAGLGTEVSLDGTSDTELAQRRVCKSGRFIRTSTVEGEASNSTEVLKVLTLDSVINLRVPVERRRSRGRPSSGRRGQRGNN